MTDYVRTAVRLLTVPLFLGLFVGWPAFGAQDTPPADAAILAVAGRQVAWLNLEAPRPRPVTNMPAPAGATDVAAQPGLPRAVVSVAAPFPGGGARGADLMLLDLSSGG